MIDPLPTASGVAIADPQPGVPGLALGDGSIGPSRANERIVELDALRGFLLYFILIANLPSFAGYWFLSPDQITALNTPLDETLLFLLDVFVHGKFYSLFSLLFGVGFAVILSRLAARGSQGIGVYRRRLLVLAGFGLVHMLIWPGDILLPYAICGFLLILFRKADDGTLLKAAAFFLALPVAYYGLAFLTDGRSDPAFWLYSFLEAVVFPVFGVEGGPLSAYQSGSVAEFVRANVVGFGLRWVGLLFEGRLFKILGVFLIGLWVGRRLLAGGILNETRLLKRTLRIGLLVGLPANVGLAILMRAQVEFPMSWPGVLQYAVYAVGVVPLALAYAAGFVLAWRSGPVRHILRAFAPMGRMALTTYVMQTLLGIGFFYGLVGPGRMGTYSPSEWMALALVVIAFQMIFAAVWLRQFRYGPLEWVWRAATYGIRGVRERRKVPMQAGRAHESLRPSR